MPRLPKILTTTTADAIHMPKRFNTLVRLASFDPKTGQVFRVVEHHNLILYSGADVMAGLLAKNFTLVPSAMYFEFKNLRHTSDAIPTPSFNRTGGIAYYNGLHAPVDVIRSPITVAPAVATSDADKYAGNQVTFFATTEGSLGAINSLPFSRANISTVYGVGLVATPDWTTQSSDVVFSRSYPGRMLKDNNYQIGCAWVIRCT